MKRFLEGALGLEQGQRWDWRSHSEWPGIAEVLGDAVGRVGRTAESHAARLTDQRTSPDLPVDQRDAVIDLVFAAREVKLPGFAERPHVS